MRENCKDEELAGCHCYSLQTVEKFLSGFIACNDIYSDQPVHTCMRISNWATVRYLCIYLTKEKGIQKGFLFSGIR